MTLQQKAKTLRGYIEKASAGLEDADAVNCPALFPSWDSGGISYAANDRVAYEGKLFKCLQAHTSQTDWAPTEAVSLWVEVTPPGTILEWKQPTGSTDAYNKGDQVTHNGSTWESLIDANVWEPTDANTTLWAKIATV